MKANRDAWHLEQKAWPSRVCRTALGSALVALTLDDVDYVAVADRMRRLMNWPLVLKFRQVALEGGGRATPTALAAIVWLPCGDCCSVQVCARRGRNRRPAAPSCTCAGNAGPAEVHVRAPE